MGKLTDRDVIAIREAFWREPGPNEGWPNMVTIGEEFGITREYVRQLVTGLTRKDAGGPIGDPVGRARTPTPPMIEEVKRLWDEGVSIAEICRKVPGVSYAAFRLHIAPALPPRSHPNATLTDRQVMMLRAARAEETPTPTYETLATRFRLDSASTAHRVATGATYAHIGGPTNSDASVTRARRPRLTDEDRANARAMSQEGLSQAQIAVKLGTTQPTISRILSGGGG